jgi:RimJ/RimL family protein N-acetyltransferase
MTTLQRPVTAPERVALRDGTTVTLRPLRSSDAPALAKAYEQLSVQARISRFGSPPAHLSGASLAHLVDVDQRDHVAFVAVAGERIVGVGRVMRYPDEPDTLDIAITIADEAQGQGLGRVLADLLAAHRPRPARRIVTAVQRENAAALRLLESFGTPVRRADDTLEVLLDSGGQS